MMKRMPKIYILITLFFIFCGIKNALADEYFIKFPENTINIEQFLAIKSTMDQEENLYVVGTLKDAPMIYFVRKYNKEKELLWSSLLYGDTDCPISILNFKNINGCLNIVYLEDLKINSLYYLNLKQDIFKSDDGSKFVPTRVLGNMRKSTTLLSSNMSESGSVSLTFEDNRSSWIEKYDQGSMQAFIMFVADETFEYVICDKNEDIYIIGKRSNQRFIRKYSANGTYLTEKFYYIYTGGFITAAKIDEDGNIYFIVNALSATCNIDPETQDVECVPTWFYLYKINKDLEIEFEKVISSEDEAATLYNITMELSDVDVYIGGTLNKMYSVYTHPKVMTYRLIMAIDRISGKEKVRYLDHAEDWEMVCSLNLYLRKNVQINDSIVTQGRMRVLTMSSPNSYSEDFWIPRYVEVTVEYKRGWNLICLPVIPSEPFLKSDYNEINPRVIYSFGKYGYIRIKDWEEIKQNIGYWLLVKEDVSFTYKGAEILIGNMNARIWNMLGGCTYPFWYTQKNKNNRPFVIYGYDPGSGGYYIIRDKNNVPPNAAYWVYFGTTGILPIHMEVNFERNKIEGEK